MFVDLNADLGESFGRWSLGEDESLLPLVTSANIACGFHAGDPATLVRTVGSAVDAGVILGAQVSYRDLAGFGRRFMDVSATDLYADVLYQVGALNGIARTFGDHVRYLKPHGALYNAVVSHPVQAAAVADAAADAGGLPVLCLPGSALAQAAAERGLMVFTEAFADRGYTPAGTLLPRNEPDALITAPEAVAARTVRMVTQQQVLAVDGTSVPVHCDSVCLHGDSPGAVASALAVRNALAEAGVGLRSFLTTP